MKRNRGTFRNGPIKHWTMLPKKSTLSKRQGNWKLNEKLWINLSRKLLERMLFCPTSLVVVQSDIAADSASIWMS